MKTVLISMRIFVFLSVLTGIIYPLFITGFAQLVFPGKANGSLIVEDNQVTGSRLIGQQFNSTIYFSSRPSAIAYNPLPSGASNFGLTNLELKTAFHERSIDFIRNNQLDSLTEIPSEMLFASASGLDPHISPEAALLQVGRIALARNFNISQKNELMEMIKKFTEKPQFSVFGEERVNVLMLNIRLDKLSDSGD